jgi:ankyrin repeat protein
MSEMSYHEWLNKLSEKQLMTRYEEELIWAVKAGDLGAATHLLDIGANPNSPNCVGSLPLTSATLSNQYNMCKLLLSRGANVNVTLRNGGTALMIASAYSLVNIVELLIANGANVNAMEQDGYTALRYACQESNVKIVKLLIDAGANVTASEISACRQVGCSHRILDLLMSRVNPA